MRRTASCGIVVATIWVILLGWTAGLSWQTPLLPRQHSVLNARDFHVIMGAGAGDDSTLRIDALGGDGNALQSTLLPHLPARDFSVLRYRFDEFPRTLELSLVFRRADMPDDVHAITLPWPGDGWRSVDLRNIPGWSGDIIELGFAEYATAQVVPASIAFKPFRFDRAELWSPSWQGGLATLYTSWLGYTPWALLSVSALGPAIETVKAPPLTPFLVLGAGLSLLASTLILGWSRQRLPRRAALSALIVWVVLDVCWLDDFHAKHRLTESLYAGKPWSERARLVPDQETATAAETVKAYLAAQPSARRILVASDAPYTLLRFIYFLLPLDVALLQEVVVTQPLPKDTLFLLYATTQWQYDAVRGSLRGGGLVYPVEPVFDNGDVHLYRLRSVQQ